MECKYRYSAPGGSLCERKTSGSCKSWGNICGGAADSSCCPDGSGNPVNCVATTGGRYQCGGDTFDWGIPPLIEYTGPILNLEQIVTVLYRILFPIGVAFGAFMVIKAGYTIMTSEGEPAKVTEAKEDLTAAVVGLLFVLLSAVILRVIISSLLGADI
ncbi:MAG TPA: pilin [Patescibacteria group bacterium]|nr:pilin [Patescibacteria group bacterium]